MLGFFFTASGYIRLEDSLNSSPSIILVLFSTLGKFYDAIFPEATTGPAFNAFILAIFSAVLGFIEPHHPWRWGFASAFLGPMLLMVLTIYLGWTQAEGVWWGFTDLSTEVLWWGIISTPVIGAGYLGAWVRVRRDRAAGQDQYRPGRYRKRRY
jgi:hypothetical protein